MIRRRMTVKRVDPWSVLKLGLVVNIAGAAILVVTGVVVWSVVRRLQLVERVCEQAQGLLGFESCAIDGVQIMRTGLMLAGLSVVVATGVMVFLAFLYNLIADLTGGVEVSMLDHSGQVRSAGGVEVSPALRAETGRGWSPTGVGRAAATTGAVDPQPTMASPRARPQTGGPLATTGSDPRGPVMGQPVPAQPQPLRDEPAPAAPPEPKGPGVLERAGAAAGAAGAAVKGAAERSGAAVKQAADKTTTKLSDAGRRATTTLADVTEAEAAERAGRARASRQTLDQLSVPVGQRLSGGGDPGGGSVGGPSGGSGGSGGGSDDLPERGDDGRFLPAGESSSRGSGRSSDGARRSGSDGSRSPQEAAAERQKARAAQRRNSSGRSSGSDGRSPDRQDDGPELMFGNHPLASSDDK